MQLDFHLAAILLLNCGETMNVHGPRDRCRSGIYHSSAPPFNRCGKNGQTFFNLAIIFSTSYNTNFPRSWDLRDFGLRWVGTRLTSRGTSFYSAFFEFPTFASCSFLAAHPSHRHNVQPHFCRFLPISNHSVSVPFIQQTKLNRSQLGLVREFSSQMPQTNVYCCGKDVDFQYSECSYASPHPLLPLISWFPPSDKNLQLTLIRVWIAVIQIKQKNHAKPHCHTTHFRHLSCTDFVHSNPKIANGNGTPNVTLTLFHMKHVLKGDIIVSLCRNGPVQKWISGSFQWKWRQKKKFNFCLNIRLPASWIHNSSSFQNLCTLILNCSCRELFRS